jgi:hypothetical protein
MKLIMRSVEEYVLKSLLLLVSKITIIPSTFESV